MRQERHAPPPDTLPKAVWAYLMENAQWVCVTLAITVLVVILVPPMLGSQRKAYDTVAQSCARAIQATLITEPVTPNFQAFMKQENVQAACGYPTLHVTPLQQPSTYAVQDSRGKRTFVVTPASVSSTP